jgi:hypothetical protein
MSVDLFVQLPVERMPTPQQWQDAITSHVFPLKLDTDFEVESFSGYLPCDLEGKPAGFEYFYELITTKELQLIQIQFSTHSDITEFFGAAIAAAVLTEMSGGTLEDPQEGIFFKGTEAIAWLREVESEVKQELEKLALSTQKPLPPKSSKPWWQFW